MTVAVYTGATEVDVGFTCLRAGHTEFDISAIASAFVRLKARNCFAGGVARGAAQSRSGVKPFKQVAEG